MSTKTGGRFDLSRLKAGTEPKTATAPAEPSEVTREKYASYLTPALKSRLKQAAAKEGRKQYEILEELIENWLDKKHPEL